MANLSTDIRLAVDSGKVAIGMNSVAESIRANTSKAVVVAVPNKKEFTQEIAHLCKLSGTRTLQFKGTSMELGAVCGKPYSIAALSIIEPGNSNILDETY